jgi:hypothetical protein
MSSLAFLLFFFRRPGVFCLRCLVDTQPGDMPSALALLCAASVASVALATELTLSTWEPATSGKTVFVKFLAPW